RRLVILAVSVCLASCAGQHGGSEAGSTGQLSSGDDTPIFCKNADTSFAYGAAVGQSCFSRGKQKGSDEFDQLESRQHHLTFGPLPAGQTASSYKSFRDYLIDSYGEDAALALDSDQRPRVRACVADAMSDGVPLFDQVAMLDAVNAR